MSFYQILMGSEGLECLWNSYVKQHFPSSRKERKNIYDIWKKNLKDRKKPQQISETCKLSNSSTSFHQSVLSCLSREKVKVVLKTDKKKKIYIYQEAK